MIARGGEGMRFRESRRCGVRLDVLEGGVVVVKGRDAAERDMAG